jgi:quinoprotein glucose dehydrogenase
MRENQIDGSERASSHWTRRIYAGALVLLGVALLVGGIVLVSNGGSCYYVIAGVLITASGVLL